MELKVKELTWYSASTSCLFAGLFSLDTLEQIFDNWPHIWHQSYLNIFCIGLITKVRTWPVILLFNVLSSSGH